MRTFGLESRFRRLVASALAAVSLVTIVSIGGSGPTAARPPAFPPPGGVLTGVARIIDGDTIDIAGTRIRLQGIDAPEVGQTCAKADGSPWDCGGDATRVMIALTAGGALECHGTALDKYGRLLATCFAGPVDISAELVERGYAWAYVYYSTAYVAQEAQARSAKIGIWQGAAQPAWDYRAAQRTHSRELAGLMPQTTGASPQRVTSSLSPAAASPSSGCAIKGNVSRSGLVYHTPSSPWYDKVSMALEKGKRWFCTEAEALAAGWRPAMVR